MSTIWKYDLEVTDTQVLRLPRGAEFLTVQYQFQGSRGCPRLWALVDPEQPPEKYTIYTFGTGHTIANAEGLSYIGTYQLMDGELVFHVFSEVDD